MAGLWRLYKPEATINYIANPSLEEGTTGYSAYTTGTATGSATRGTTWQKRGFYGYRIVKSGGGASDHYGVEIDANSPTDFTSGEDVTFSVDLNVAASTTVEIEIEATVGGSPEGATLEVAAASEGRYSVSHTLTGNATAVTARVYVKSGTGTVDIDGLQVENKAHATSYCDGDQPGCDWTGLTHASASTRDARVGAAGRAFNLDDLEFFIENPSGWGMAPVRHLVQPQAQLPGSLYRGSVIDPAIIVLSGKIIGTGHEDTHLERRDLIAFFREDVTDNQPILLEYLGADSDTPVRIPVVYDTGLEGSAYDGFTENAAVRLIAYDPYWSEDGETADTLSGGVSITNANYAIHRRAVEDQWRSVSSAFNADVRVMAEAPDGTIYFGGDFTNVGDANGDYIVSYNPETDVFTSLGTGTNGVVHAIAIGSDGTVYAGGAFTSAGGVANTQYLAAWNGSVWSTVHTGGNNSVFALAIGPDGTLYAGGDFTQLNSAAYNRIAQRSTAGTWSGLGTGLNSTCYALVAPRTGGLYAGGAFSTAGGTSVDGVAYWSGSAWAAVGGDITGTVRSMAIGPDGLLYCAGSFDDADGSTEVNSVTRWNGAAFEPLGQGLQNSGSTATVRAIAFDENGILYATGLFSESGDVSLNSFAQWNGSLWVSPSVVVPSGVGTGLSLLQGLNGDFYVGYDASGTATAPGITTVSYDGTAPTYPIIEITRSAGTSAKLRWIENQTIGAIMFFDYDLLDGEKLTIDLTPGARTVTSSVFGLRWGAILQASNIAQWRMIPGDNDIAVLIEDVGSPNMTIAIRWVTRHASADGVAS